MPEVRVIEVGGKGVRLITRNRGKQGCGRERGHAIGEIKKGLGLQYGNS